MRWRPRSSTRRPRRGPQRRAVPLALVALLGGGLTVLADAIPASATTYSTATYLYVWDTTQGSTALPSGQDNVVNYGDSISMEVCTSITSGIKVGEYLPGTHTLTIGDTNGWYGLGYPGDSTGCYSGSLIYDSVGTDTFTGDWGGVTSGGDTYGPSQSAALEITANPVGPAWTSAPGGDTVAVGQNWGDGFSASGEPTPGFSESGSLPCGVTFGDNGNGSAGIGGAPCGGTGGSYPITVWAANSGGTIGSGYTLTVLQPPVFTSAASATFVVGSAGTVGIAASGYPAPAITESGALPTGVSFANGVLSGTPAGGTGGTWTPSFTASSAAGSVTTTFDLVVQPAGTAISVSSPGGSVGGTATVTAHVSPAPDAGTVAFGDTNGYVTGCGAVPASAGAATCVTHALAAAGIDTVTARYGGDASYAASPVASSALTVSPAATTVALSASPANPAVGSTTLLTATVSPIPDGGTVALVDSQGYIAGCGEVTLSSGRAACATGVITSLSTDTITATYSGDANYRSSASTLSLGPVPGTPSLALGASSATAGGTATITATLDLAPGASTVAFGDADGYISGCGAVPVSGTTVSCTTGTLAAVGDDLVTANYSGDASYHPTSASLTLVIGAAPLAAVSSSSAPSSTSSGSSVPSTGNGTPLTAGAGQELVGYRFAASLSGARVASIACTVGPTAVLPVASGGVLKDLGLHFSCDDGGHIAKVSAAMTTTTVTERVARGHATTKRVTVWRGEIILGEPAKHLQLLLVPASASLSRSLVLSGSAVGYPTGSRSQTAPMVTSRVILRWRLRPIVGAVPA